MPDIDAKATFKKYAPSASQFLFRSGLILFFFMIAGIAYGQFFMEVPPELTGQEKSRFRLGLGFIAGLLLSVVPFTLLFMHYIFKLFQAKKLAEKEVLDFYLNELEGK